MNKYYKIYKDNTVVDVNNMFYLRQPHGRIIITNTLKGANLISNSDGSKFYTANFLCPLNTTVPGVEWVKAKLITEEEYNTLYEQLQLGNVEEEEEEIPVEVEQPEPIMEEPEKVMTVNEMRNKINELETIIKQLISKM